MATLHTETSQCLFFVWCCEAGRILAQPVDFHCELFMVSLNGALMKNGDLFRPHCSCQILLLGTTFIKKSFFYVLWPRLIFVPISMLIWENISVSFQDTKQPPYSMYYFFQTVLHCGFIEVRSPKPSLMCLLCFDLIYLMDVLKWNICIPPIPSYISQSHIVLTLVTFYMSAPVTGLTYVLAEAFCLSSEKKPMNEHSS